MMISVVDNRQSTMVDAVDLLDLDLLLGVIKVKRRRKHGCEGRDAATRGRQNFPQAR